MSANLEIKKQVVEDITAKIKNSKSVVFVNYKGLTVAEVTELRNSFRKSQELLRILPLLISFLPYRLYNLR